MGISMLSIEAGSKESSGSAIDSHVICPNTSAKRSIWRVLRVGTGIGVQSTSEVAKRILYLPYANGTKAYLIRELIERIAGVGVAYMWQPEGLRGHYGWACTWS